MVDPIDDRARGRRALIDRALILAVVVAAFVLALFPLRSFDTGYHVKFGEHVWATKSVPTEDIFSFASAGPWVNPAWLSGVLFHGVFSLGGVGALVLLKAFVVAGIAALMVHTARREGVAPAARLAAAFLMLYSMRIRFLCRPLIFTALLLAATIYVLRGFAARRGNRGLWLLPPICLLWANLHAGFFIAFAILPIYLLHELRRGDDPSSKTRRVWMFIACAACCVAATLVNPYGYRALTHPFTITTSAHLNFTTEWQALPFDVDMFYRWDPRFLNSFAFFWITLALLAAAVARTWRRVSLIDALTVVLFTIMATVSQRHVLLFGVAVYPVLAKHLDLALGPLVRWLAPRVRTAGLWVLAVGLVAAGLGLRFGFDDRGIGLGVARNRYPEKAADFITSAGIGGRLFNRWTWGSYLTWRFYPDRKIFADGRFEAYDEQVYDDWLTVDQAGQGWEGILGKYDINVAIVTPSAWHASKLTSDNWRLVYWDDLALVFVRNAPANQKIIEQYACDLSHPVTFMAHLGDPASAAQVEEQLRAKIASDPTCAKAHSNLALVLVRAGHHAEAREHMSRAMELQPWSPLRLIALGRQHLRMGRLDEAGDALRRAWRMPNSRPGRSVIAAHLGDYYLAKGDSARAAKYYRKALDLVPGHPGVKAKLDAVR